MFKARNVFGEVLAMKRERMLGELEDAARTLGIKVIIERLSPEASPGGLCRVGGEYRVLVDKHLPIIERITVLVSALARFSTEDIFLSPEVRVALERRAAELVAELPSERPAKLSTERPSGQSAGRPAGADDAETEKGDQGSGPLPDPSQGSEEP